MLRDTPCRPGLEPGHETGSGLETPRSPGRPSECDRTYLRFTILKYFQLDSFMCSTPLPSYQLYLARMR